jgi:DNA sulfur modification protein DndB
VSDPDFGYSFPAIRGLMAKREYYVSMCPLRLIPRIFLFDEEEAALPPQLRAQRVLNRGRIPEMSEYLAENRDSYVFSALTASIDADVTFTPIGKSGEASKIGTLRVPMDAKFIINDGQHRRAAIEEALRLDPDLGDESIAIVFFMDRGLSRSQQMFADLNRYAIRTSRSLGVLYDHRDQLATISKLVVLESPILRNLVELEQASLSKRSRKLFTLSALHFAIKSLLKGMELTEEESVNRSQKFFHALFDLFPEWKKVHNRELTSGEVREEYIHPHAIALQALGRAGNLLLQEEPQSWKSRLSELKKLDWKRSNRRLWEGRAIIDGRLSKANRQVALTTVLLKQKLGLTLTVEEKQLNKKKRSTSVAK